MHSARGEQSSGTRILPRRSSGSACGLGGVGRHDENRAVRPCDHLLHRAAEHPARETSFAMAREHDQVDVVLVREMNDLLGRPALSHRDVGGEAGGTSWWLDRASWPCASARASSHSTGSTCPLGAVSTRRSVIRAESLSPTAAANGRAHAATAEPSSGTRMWRIVRLGVPGGVACGRGEGGAAASRLRVPRGPLSESGDLQERVG